MLDPGERIDNLEFFPEVPVIRGLATTWEGHIWVLRRGEDPLGRRSDRQSSRPTVAIFTAFPWLQPRFRMPSGLMVWSPSSRRTSWMCRR